jgi:hypothetical protein
MYGYDPDTANDRPFNGVGRLHTYGAGVEYQTRNAKSPPAYMNPFYLPLDPNKGNSLGNPCDDFDLVNYTFFRDDPQVLSLCGAPFLRDPERINPLPNTGPVANWWTMPGRPWPPPWRTNPSQTPGPYTGGVNAPYTYPDGNNLFLAAVRADGSVLLPSFHRPCLGLDTMDSSNPAFWKWTSNTDQAPGPGQGRPMPWLKYLTLRPRPADHPKFPPPEDGGGDVKNLLGSPGTLIPGTSPPQYWVNDSIWIDLGFPVLTDPSGLRYKPLFAPLIVDLDSRINVNVAGNARGAGGTHASHQGWGLWEMNLGHVLDYPGNESVNLLLGSAGQPGRYGADQQPGPGGFAAGLATVPHFYARVDFDATNELAAGAPTGPMQLPAPGSFSCFPSFPPGYGDGSPAERRNHPLGSNAFLPSGDDSLFGWANLEGPLRYGDTGSHALTSDLFRLARGNFGDASSPTAALAATRRRNLVTTHSFDLDRAGVAPGIWNPSWHPYAYTSPPAPTALGDNRFPGLSRRYGHTGPRPGAPHVPAGSEFQSPGLPPSDPRVDWRCRIGGLQRLDVNRPLPEYPLPDPATGLLDFTDPATLRQFQAAQAARQGLARDLFLVLVTATGVADPRTSSAPLPNDVLQALRWLAQLAVNMVDFIDADDYVTPFNWGGDPLIWTGAAALPYPGEWVFGTELPRVVINEAYVQQAGPYENVWVELHNTFRTDPTLTDDVLGVRGAARLQVPGGHNVYQLVLAQGRKPGEPGIDPTTGQPVSVLGMVADFNPPPTPNPNGGPPAPPPVDTRVILPSDGAFAGPNGGNRGFYLLGPRSDDGAISFPGSSPPDLPVATLASPGMRFPAAIPVSPTLILRRLACPHFPENDPTQPGYDSTLPYNPFVTVDYLEQVDPDPFFSVGRVQPYVGGNSPVLRRAQQPVPPPDGQATSSQPQHTFFQHNAREIWPNLPDPARPDQTLQMPFDWPVQLDRPLISPMELLSVPACPPHLLTHRFCSTFTTTADNPVFTPGVNTVATPTTGYSGGYPWSIRVGMQLLIDNGANQETVSVTAVTSTGFTALFVKPHPPGFVITGAQPQTHLAPWFNQTSRLYRAFEFLETRCRVAGLEAPATLSTGGIGPSPALPGIRTVTPEKMRGVSPSGIPWSIDAGDTLIIDSGASQENVVVLATTSTTFTAPFVQTHNPGFTIQLSRTGERIPGKININTIWDVETLRAVCDPQPGNGFTLAQVDAIWNDMISPTNPQARTRGAGGFPSGTDRPFRSLATSFTANGPQYPAGLDINDTLFRFGSGSSPLFEVPGASHPYQQNELLTKVFNNLTTRSNVFGVWVTVGFFEVTDETVRPVRLGAEVGRAVGANLRHRMFAVVDRTNLVAQVNAAGVAAYLPAPGVLSAGAMPALVTRTSQAVTDPATLPPGTGKTVGVEALAGVTPVPTPPDGSPALQAAWEIAPGVALVIERGTKREETVLVTGVSPSAFTAPFTQPHPAGSSVTVVFYRGNPGARSQFRVRDNKDLVPYYSIIN